MKFLKKTFSFIFILLALYPRTASAEQFDLSGYDSIGVYACELNSEEVLIAQNEHVRMYPGSITKVMTILVACDYLDEQQEITVTKDALDLVGYNSSVAELAEDEVLTFSQLIYATLLPSGNDAAIVVALAAGEKILGTQATSEEYYEAFIAKMNEKAAVYGMNETHFSNADGYDDTNNYSTAYDIFILGKVALEHEAITKASETSAVTVTTNTATHIWKSTNGMHHEYLDDFSYDYSGDNPYYDTRVTGMKTGYTSIGQKCFLMTAEADNMKVVGVLLNVPIEPEEMEIWAKAESIMSYIYDKHTYTVLINDDNRKTTLQIANPSFLKKGEFNIYASKDVSSCVENELLENIKVTIEINPEAGNYTKNNKVKLNKSIHAGDVVATAVFVSGETVIKQVDLIATEDFRKAGILDYLLYAIIICATLAAVRYIIINIKRAIK